MTDSNDDARGRLGVLDDTVAASDHSARAPRSRPLQPPAPDYPTLAVVDPAHYAVLHEIARGGMGRIHAARDRRLGREVAIKEVLFSDGPIVRRFEREARITARLQHPAIVSVHEAGVWPSGEPFYVMRLVAGRSLDVAIAAAASFEARLALVPNVLAIADAMAYAHGQRVIHRDLKPRNVVVGEFGDTVVIDWGLAKDLSAPGAADDAVTASGDADLRDGETEVGDVLGTPAYMPPEQAAGDPVDERADVYAIGALLYQVLAGRAPYTGSSQVEVLAALQEGPPEPVTAHARDAPRELVAIVERAMARQPAGRYATARELADDLRRFQNGQLVGAHRYSLSQLLRRWARRHRTALAAVMAAVVASAAIGVYAVVRIAQQRALAVAHQHDAEELMSFMLVELGDRLTQLRYLDVLDTVAQKARSYYDKRGDAGTDEDIFLSATARGAIAHVLRSRGDVDAADAALDKQRTLLTDLVSRRSDVPKYRVALAAADLDLADVKDGRADLPDAMRLARAVVPGLEQVVAEHPDDASSRHWLAYARSDVAAVLEHQGDVDGALAMYRGVAALVSEPGYTGPQAEHDRLVVHADLGHLLGVREHDFRAALPEDRQALAISEQLLAADPRNLLALKDVAANHGDVSLALAETDDLAGARSEADAALEAATRLFTIDPDVGTRKRLQAAHQRVGDVLLALKDYAGATTSYAAATAIEEQLAAQDPKNGDTQRELSVDLNKLGDVQLASREIARALDSYRRALTIRERLVAADPSDVAWRRDVFYSHYKLSTAYGAMPGHGDDALAELRRALDIVAATVASNPSDAGALDDLAETYEEIGKLLVQHQDLAGARAELHLALDIARHAAAGPHTSEKWRHLVDKLEGELAAAGERASTAR